MGGEDEEGSERCFSCEEKKREVGANLRNTEREPGFIFRKSSCILVGAHQMEERSK